MLASLIALALQAAAPPSPAPVAATAAAPASRWAVADADHIVRGFRFASGETMDVRMHYATLGAPHRDASGEIDNAVMLIHGTGGTGHQFLAAQFAEALFGPGQPLDIRKYWIILPDNVGHGASSKPSDGMRMAFPKYDYDDMVGRQYRLLTDGLKIRRMRLIFGTSMGCMHGFVWGEAHPDFARALMPMACEPVALAGLNRMWRQMSIDAIQADPAWAGGNYAAQPLQGLRTASSITMIAGAAPLYFQKMWPTREAATTEIRARIARDLPTRDANDFIYQMEASRNYDPWPRLEAIVAPVTWINSADDFINPRGLTFPQAAVKRMKDARFRVIAETDDTRGHGTHTWAKFWADDLVDLLKRTEAK